MTVERYNPRYIAYASAQGLSPKAAMIRDADLWPGGKMAGYILWIHHQWATWDAKMKHKSNHIRSVEEHRAFDAWLEGGRL